VGVGPGLGFCSDLFNFTFTMKINIQALVDEILLQSAALAAQLISDYATKAQADVAQYVNDSKDDLTRWTQELTDKKLSQDEFQDLVKGDIDVAVLHGLKRSGDEQISIDKFKNGVVTIITSVALSAANAVITPAPIL
jgi:hypothetical protein